uniref:mannan endo-1,4-beta-mannosidase n=1 Tax=Glaciozyma antarctica TaxID=105987 RepID=A0A0U1V0D8_9BASI|nr:psychrophilic beta-mannanase [Glaciozyma antarctica]
MKVNPLLSFIPSTRSGMRAILALAALLGLAIAHPPPPDGLEGGKKVFGRATTTTTRLITTITRATTTRRLTTSTKASTTTTRASSTTLLSSTLVTTTRIVTFSSSTASLAAPTLSSSSATTVPTSQTTTVPTSQTTLAPTTLLTTVATTTLITSTACASVYTGAIHITGTGTLPKPSSFIKRTTLNQGFTVGPNGVPFRVVGPNIYWLCNDENLPGEPKAFYTDKTRIREALAQAVAMGANTVRAISCGTSVGTPYSIQPTLNTFAAQWDTMDYVIYAAGQYGLRLILPLTDNYDYYHGGKYTFLRWRGLSTANGGALFFTDPTVIADFQRYIRTILTHVNVSYLAATGKPYHAEQSIMAWETGNELGGYIGAEGYPPQSWTTLITQTIRAVDQAHIILDGSNGFYNYTNKATSPSLNITAIGAMSDHGYPRNLGLLDIQIPLATAAKKGFLIGEYDWTDKYGGVSLPSYLAAIEKTTYIGDLVWGVQGHDARCCSYLAHEDGYSIYYPNGNSAAEQVNILALVQHFYRMTKRAVPSVLPSVLCPQPVF